MADLRIKESYNSGIVKFEMDGSTGLVDTEVGRGLTRIRPVRGTVEYRDGKLYSVQIEGRIIKKDGTEANGRNRWQRWSWLSFWSRGASWPPDAAPPLALAMVEQASSRLGESL